MDNLKNRAEISAEFIRDWMGVKPDTAIILGSGLSGFENNFKNKREINYSDIPEFPVSTAPGHKGKLILCEREDEAGNYDTSNDDAGRYILIMSGRFHHYEGYSLQEITIPIRVMAILGIKRLIITNASGAVNENYKAGDLMLIEDHINLSGDNPLIGPNFDELGPRFPDMTYTYSPQLIKKIKEKADKKGILLRQGVYTFMTGPSYETPAEVRMIRTLGADCVGMSSVPEAIVARHSGMEIVGISCITNMASGILDKPLSGDEVIEAGKRAMLSFSEIIFIAINA
ncbi:purine-nucleoside phosphorylase [Alterileibacterium massiliense]|uniref:purine-nucleoside phosphorylase n=1 Tax=Alterileibacterium massiliense TaxID=1870997 RepID=UPI0008DAF6A5|nr:purine-nucleoside phosphorylase [Alterileibacterium massiliense]